MLKQRSSRNECIGTCRTERVCESHIRHIVPWIRECNVRNSDWRRKALFESVASVKGRNMRIWRAVDSLQWSVNFTLSWNAFCHSPCCICHCGPNEPRIQHGWVSELKECIYRSVVQISLGGGDRR